MYLKTWIIGGSKIKQPKASGAQRPDPLPPRPLASDIHY